MTEHLNSQILDFRNLIINSFGYNGNPNLPINLSLLPYSSLKFHRFLSSLAMFVNTDELALISPLSTIADVELYLSNQANHKPKESVYNSTQNTSSSVLPLINRSSFIIGVGTDIENVDHSSMFLVKESAHLRSSLFHPSEILHCLRSSDPELSMLGVFCAKEATIKACSRYIDVDFKDIIVYWDKCGAPLCRLRSNSGIIIHISISHTTTFATATALASR